MKQNNLSTWKLFSINITSLRLILYYIKTIQRMERKFKIKKEKAIIGDHVWLQLVTGNTKAYVYI